MGWRELNEVLLEVEAAYILGEIDRVERRIALEALATWSRESI